jgi:hypothetical protein
MPELHCQNVEENSNTNMVMLDSYFKSFDLFSNIFINPPSSCPACLWECCISREKTYVVSQERLSLML